MSVLRRSRLHHPSRSIQLGFPETFATGPNPSGCVGRLRGTTLGRKGKLQLISTDFTGPNGIAFSPDEKYLYVGDWDDKKKVVMRYEAKPDGTLANGKLFFDMTAAPGEDALDGIKVDRAGNLYVSGPGGLWVISPEGKHLGTILTPRHVHNMAWGDEDGRTLYLCGRSALYRMRMNIPGMRP